MFGQASGTRLGAPAGGGAGGDGGGPSFGLDGANDRRSRKLQPRRGRPRDGLGPGAAAARRANGGRGGDSRRPPRENGADLKPAVPRENGTGRTKTRSRRGRNHADDGEYRPSTSSSSTSTSSCGSGTAVGAAVAREAAGLVAAPGEEEEERPLPDQPYARRIYEQLRRDGIRAPSWPANPGDPASKAALARFRDQYRIYRDRVRTSLIRAGLIDNPDDRKRLEDAIDFRGICEDMCPDWETVTRMSELDIKAAERDPATGQPVPARFVKKLARSAAGQEAPLPMDVRSISAMRRTIEYLVGMLRSDRDLAGLHGFLWDRTRAIRRDFAFFSALGPEELREQVYCLETITRFHVVSLHLLARPGCTPDDYSEHQEIEQLGNSLMSLRYAYDDCRAAGVACPNEAEFRAYELILKANSPAVLETAQREAGGAGLWAQSNEVRTAVTLVEALHSTHHGFRGPLTRAPLVAADCSPHAYLRVLEDNPAVTYTMACFAEIHLGQLRRSVLESLRRAFSRPRDRPHDVTAATLNRHLGFDDVDGVIAFAERLGLRFEEPAGPFGDRILVLDGTAPVSHPKLTHQFSIQFVESKRGHRGVADLICTTASSSSAGSGPSFKQTSRSGENGEEESLFVAQSEPSSPILKPAPGPTVRFADPLATTATMLNGAADFSQGNHQPKIPPESALAMSLSPEEKEVAPDTGRPDPVVSSPSPGGVATEACLVPVKAASSAADESTPGRDTPGQVSPRQQPWPPLPLLEAAPDTSSSHTKASPEPRPAAPEPPQPTFGINTAAPNPGKAAAGGAVLEINDTIANACRSAPSIPCASQFNNRFGPSTGQPSSNPSIFGAASTTTPPLGAVSLSSPTTNTTKAVESSLFGAPPPPPASTTQLFSNPFASTAAPDRGRPVSNPFVSTPSVSSAASAATTTTATGPSTPAPNTASIFSQGGTIAPSGPTTPVLFPQSGPATWIQPTTGTASAQPPAPAAPEWTSGKLNRFASFTPAPSTGTADGGLFQAEGQRSGAPGPSIFGDRIENSGVARPAEAPPQRPQEHFPIFGSSALTVGNANGDVPPPIHLIPPTPVIPRPSLQPSRPGRPAQSVPASTSILREQSARILPLERTTAETEAAAIASASAGAASPPARISRDDFLDRFSSWFVTGDQGLLEQFENHMVGQLVGDVWCQFRSEIKQAEKRRQREAAEGLEKTARDLHRRHLMQRYFALWREVARQKRLGQVCREGRERARAYYRAKRTTEVKRRKVAAAEEALGTSAATEELLALIRQRSRRRNTDTVAASGLLTGLRVERDAISNIAWSEQSSAVGDMGPPRVPQSRDGRDFDNESDAGSTITATTTATATTTTTSKPIGAKTRQLMSEFGDLDFRRSLPSLPTRDHYLSMLSGPPQKKAGRANLLSPRWRLKTVGSVGAAMSRSYGPAAAAASSDAFRASSVSFSSSSRATNWLERDSRSPAPIGSRSRNSSSNRTEVEGLSLSHPAPTPAFKPGTNEVNGVHRTATSLSKRKRRAADGEWSGTEEDEDEGQDADGLAKRREMTGSMEEGQSLVEEMRRIRQELEEGVRWYKEQNDLMGRRKIAPTGL